MTMQRPKHKLLVYTSESPLRHPLTMVKSMFADLFASSELAWRLTARDISAQYRQTALGYFWAIFPPLVTSLIFIILNQANVIQTGVIEIPYPLFIISGTIFWQLFVDALNAPLKVLSVNRSLLSKVNIPKESLILSAIGQTLFSFVIKLILLVVVLLAFHVPITWTIMFIVIPIAGLLAIGILGGLLLAPLGMLYLDIQQGILLGSSALIFFTPVLFSPAETGFLGRVMALNPLSPFLLSMRAILFNGSFAHLLTATSVFLVTVVLLFFGWVLYRIAIPILIERMDA